MSHQPQLLTIVRDGKEIGVARVHMLLETGELIIDRRDVREGDTVMAPEFYGEGHIVDDVQRPPGSHARIRLITHYKLGNLRGSTPTVQNNTINNNAPVIGPQVAGNNNAPLSANVSISQLLELLADQMERSNVPPDPERTSFIGKLRKLAAEGAKIAATEVVKEVAKYVVGLGVPGAP